MYDRSQAAASVQTDLDNACDFQIKPDQNIRDKNHNMGRRSSMGQGLLPLHTNKLEADSTAPWQERSQRPLCGMAVVLRCDLVGGADCVFILYAEYLFFIV